MTPTLTPLTTSNALARMLDHALLHPTLTDAEVLDQTCSLLGYPLASLCVKPCHVALVAERLKKASIGVGTVIGFPHGVTTTATKAAESRLACEQGAIELDMVANTGKALGGQWDDVRQDIAEVLAVAHGHDALLKVIFETDFLTEDDDKIRLCEICSELNVDFVKTSTGFGFVKQPDGSMAYAGATDHDIALMRKHTPASVGVKPSGGVRTLDDVLRFYALGATRFGTTSSHAILAAAREHFGEEASHAQPPTTTPDGHRQLEY